MYLWWNLYVYVLVASFFLHRLYLKQWIWPDGFLLPIFNIFKGMKNKKGKHHCLVHSVQLLTRVWMNCNNGVSCHHISHSKIAKIVFFFEEKKNWLEKNTFVYMVVIFMLWIIYQGKLTDLRQMNQFKTNKSVQIELIIFKQILGEAMNHIQWFMLGY